MIGFIPIEKRKRSISFCIPVPACLSSLMESDRAFLSTAFVKQTTSVHIIILTSEQVKSLLLFLS